MVKRKEGALRDLGEKRQKGEITDREAYNEVYKRGLQHNNYSSPITGFVMLVGGVLCYVSLFANVSQLTFLYPLSQLPTIVFPSNHKMRCHYSAYFEWSWYGLHHLSAWNKGWIRLEGGKRNRNSCERRSLYNCETRWCA
jgi:hypothetical protein